MTRGGSASVHPVESNRKLIAGSQAPTERLSRAANRAGREVNRDRRALADHAFGAHRAAMRFDEVPNDGQAKSGAAFASAPAEIDAIEALEDAAEMFEG